MGTNLIQNYIAAKSTPQQKVSVPQKPRPDFDIQHELDNRTFIKPLKGKGRLLTGNVLSSPKYTVDNILYNLRAFKHAAKGDANDHELGKLNDLGLMTGGLAIASYLTTKRFTPMTKGMEFVGLGAFLASMSLWPKIAIQLPAYLIHGVNVKKNIKTASEGKNHSIKIHSLFHGICTQMNKSKKSATDWVLIKTCQTAEILSKKK